jgi:hypothetical protein
MYRKVILYSESIELFIEARLSPPHKQFFLARGRMIRLLAQPLPPSYPRDNLLRERGGEGGGRGSESYNRKKA